MGGCHLAAKGTFLEEIGAPLPVRKFIHLNFGVTIWNFGATFLNFGQVFEFEPKFTKSP